MMMIAVVPLFLLAASTFQHVRASPQAGYAPTLEERGKISSKVSVACSAISKAGIPVYYAPSPEFAVDIEHYAKNAANTPACVVEPSTVECVSKILKIIAKYRTPFAVQSGGHSTNPGFSSTTGVHISLTRFKQVKLSQDRKIVNIGAGLRWGDVYKQLEGTGRTAVGGRVGIVGVGGFLTYGGGYSFHTSQHGLGVDLVIEYTLVLPNGQIKKVNAKSDNKLFNALKGSGNNFGIVTNFKLKTVPAPKQVWGGAIVYSGDKFAQVSAAAAAFSANNKDPKASLLPSLAGVIAQKAGLSNVQMFYDGPSPPPGIFDEILALEPLQISPGFGTQNFSNLINSVDAKALAFRNYYHPVPVKAYTPRLLKAMSDFAIEYGVNAKGAAQSGIALNLAIEPFSLSAFTHSSGKEAYLHDEKHACLPTNVAVVWALPADDAYWKQTIDAIAANLTAIAESEGQDLKDCPLYPNYSLYDTPLEKVYLDNLPKLKKLQNSIDPTNIMGLAGGFKL